MIRSFLLPILLILQLLLMFRWPVYCIDSLLFLAFLKISLLLLDSFFEQILFFLVKVDLIVLLLSFFVGVHERLLKIDQIKLIYLDYPILTFHIHRRPLLK